jgi:hypothetical protein
VRFVVLTVVTVLSLPSSDMLHCVDWQFFTHILEQPAASIFSARKNELADYTAPHPTRHKLFITTFTYCTPVAHILKQMDPVHIITDYFHKIQFIPSSHTFQGL